MEGKEPSTYELTKSEQLSWYVEYLEKCVEDYHKRLEQAKKELITLHNQESCRELNEKEKAKIKRL